MLTTNIAAGQLDPVEYYHGGSSDREPRGSRPHHPSCPQAGAARQDAPPDVRCARYSAHAPLQPAALPGDPQSPRRLDGPGLVPPRAGPLRRPPVFRRRGIRGAPSVSGAGDPLGVFAGLVGGQEEGAAVFEYPDWAHLPGHEGVECM